MQGSGAEAAGVVDITEPVFSGLWAVTVVQCPRSTSAGKLAKAG